MFGKDPQALPPLVVVDLSPLSLFYYVFFFFPLLFWFLLVWVLVSLGIGFPYGDGFGDFLFGSERWGLGMVICRFMVLWVFFDLGFVSKWV